MRIKVSDYIVNRIIDRGTNVFFGYQGGNISHLIDSIGSNPNAIYVETCHEQAAAFAANSYAHYNDRVGIALASSGPGAINMINGVANAFCDSIPCIFFTGDVNTTVKNIRSSKRQNAFQEIDIISMVQSITKYATSIDCAENIIPELEKAFFISTSGRPGPVLINLPHDVQRSFIEMEDFPKTEMSCNQPPDINHIKQLQDDISHAERPLFLIGGGLKGTKARRLFNSVLDECHIPVVCSLLGLDILTHNHPCYRGVIGDYGESAANAIIKMADCIVVLGSRLDDRQLSVANARELSDVKVWHVDIDPNEFGNKIEKYDSIVCDSSAFLTSFKLGLENIQQHESWLNTTRDLYDKYNQFNKDFYHPNMFIHEMSKQCEAIYTFDVGNNQMHAMQSLFVHGNTRIMTSGGLGSMGYALPSGIGACFSDKVNKVICICGDGGLQMNIQELQTISYYKLPISIVLLNNAGLGMIYELQNKLFEGRHTGTTEYYGIPNFEKIARAYGFDYCKIKKRTDFEEAINNLKHKDRVFIEMIFDIDTSVTMN